MTSNPPGPNEARRAACKVCIGSLAATSVGAVGYPVVSFLGFPQRPDAERPVEVALDRLLPGQAAYVDRRGQQLIVLSRSEGPLVFSAACTHLGCNVIWEAAEGVFHCPCHGAQFDGEGQVISGPVNAPLKRIPFEVSDGTLRIG